MKANFLKKIENARPKPKHKKDVVYAPIKTRTQILHHNKKLDVKLDEFNAMVDSICDDFNLELNKSYKLSEPGKKTNNLYIII